MRTRKKGAALAALLMAGLMLVGTACGGSSSKSNESSSSSGSSSETTAKSDGGGGDAGSCADLFNKTEELSAKLEASMSTSTGSVDDLSSMVSALESFTSSVPSAIREDWKTLVSGLQDYADAMKGVDMNNLMDPATQDKVMKAAASMDDAKFQQASDNLDAWVVTNCPSYANK